MPCRVIRTGANYPTVERLLHSPLRLQLRRRGAGTAISVLEPYTPPNVPHGLPHVVRFATLSSMDLPIDVRFLIIMLARFAERARGGVSGQLHPVRDLPDRVPSHRRALDQPGRRLGDTAQGTREREERTVRSNTYVVPGRGPGMGSRCRWAIRTPTPWWPSPMPAWS